MVIVGYRWVNGKDRFLLQNWWKSKACVDVDYLLKSKAAIHFLLAPQMEMGKYPTSVDVLVKCNVGLDAYENFLPEG